MKYLIYLMDKAVGETSFEAIFDSVLDCEQWQEDINVKTDNKVNPDYFWVMKEFEDEEIINPDSKIYDI